MRRTYWTVYLEEDHEGSHWTADNLEEDEMGVTMLRPSYSKRIDDIGVDFTGEVRVPWCRIHFIWKD